MHRSGPRCQAPRGTITGATPQHRAVKPVVRRSGADRPCGPPGRRRHAQRGVATSVARAVRGERAARRPRPPGERREGARTDGTRTCSCMRARRWLCSCLPPPVRPRHYLRLPPCGRRQTMPHLRRCPKSGCRDFVTSSRCLAGDRPAPRAHTAVALGRPRMHTFSTRAQAAWRNSYRTARSAGSPSSYPLAAFRTQSRARPEQHRQTGPPWGGPVLSIDPQLLMQQPSWLVP
jgi:hypothetical protein